MFRTSFILGLRFYVYVYGKRKSCSPNSTRASGTNNDGLRKSTLLLSPIWSGYLG